MFGPLNIQELIENLKEEIDFSEETHYFGELKGGYRRNNYQVYTFYDSYIAGNYKYIGMINKKTKWPSDFGRLINDDIE